MIKHFAMKPITFLTIAALFLVAFSYTPIFGILSTISKVSIELKEDNFTSSKALSTFGPPRLAYAIFGANGDGPRMKRLLQALYHPRNHYVLHLDADSSSEERLDLSEYVISDPTFVKVKNVHFISKANHITYMGPTMVACTLHAASVLLKKSKEWDWFINLSASDYPLVTQDDLLHVLSYIPRDLNFIEHTSALGWKEKKRAMPLVVDPGLHLSIKTDLLRISTEKRQLPTNFRLFTGSAWMILSQSFVEYLIWGWDNLPRIILMYYTNIVTSAEGYFQTVICNVEDFKNTTINHDMHYISWDQPPQQHPRKLTIDSFPNLIESGAPFARKFSKDDLLLDKIDELLLGRPKGSFTPGAWCVSKDSLNPCSIIGKTNILNPGPGSQHLHKLLLKLLSKELFRPRQCAT